MKVNQPVVRNIEIATEAYETALDITEDQQKALDRVRNNIDSYMEFDNGSKFITGKSFVQCFIDHYNREMEYDDLSKQISSIVNFFDEDKEFGPRKLGQIYDKLDSSINKNRSNFINNLNTLESFRDVIQEDYEAGSRHFPDNWTASDVYIGTEEKRKSPNIELFQSNLSEDNLKETSMAEHLENLEDTIDYLEELIDYNQQIVDEDTVKANEKFYEDVVDFNFPILEGLLESLRIAKNEKQGLEHFLIHNDEHDYLVQRWRKELEHDLFGSEWTVYGQEVDYLEDEPLEEKNQLPDSADADYWVDGEFDILLKNGDEYAYIEIKSYEEAEEDARDQLERIDNYDSLLIDKEDEYVPIKPDNIKKFWTNQKPRFNIDYSEEITQSSSEVAKLDEAH